jgi:hypothetical protein
MAETSKLERYSWIAGIIGSVAAIIGLAVAFKPEPKPTQQQPVAAVDNKVKQQAGDNATQIGQVSGGTVEVNNNQIADAKFHAIPTVFDLTYEEAHDALIKKGWLPVNRSMMDGNLDLLQNGNGPVFWAKGYRELRWCSPTGEAFCQFLYTDPQGNFLTVVTSGEEQSDGSTKAHVSSAHLETPEEKTKRLAQDNAN